MTVAVVIPTIPGRDEDFDRCVTAYQQTSPDARLIIERDHPSCGHAWIAGAQKAEADGFDYLHFTADDLEPLPGWLEAAVETVDAGMIPAPLVFTPHGSLESAGLTGFGLNGTYTDWGPVDGTTIPFMTREMWDAIGMIPVHYCSDLWVSTVGRWHGWETVVREPMRFKHYTAPAGRNYGRAGSDTQEYIRLVREAEKARTP